MSRIIGANTWIWTSPLTDGNLKGIAEHVKALGFTGIELPLESPGDWDPSATREVLDDLGLAPFVVGAMAPGRDLIASDAVAPTIDYLRTCIDAAAVVGSSVVAGPFYAATGRTWRMDTSQRRSVINEYREALKPLVDHAGTAGVALAIEPLNRYETSVINTVEQALDALEPLLGEHLGLALDTYHLNIEEKDMGAAIEAAGEHIKHVQVCGNDRGAVGDDHIDWPHVLRALDTAGYGGALTVESFTGDNDAIATAASIWRPLAPSQDDIASRSLAHLQHQLAELEGSR